MRHVLPAQRGERGEPPVGRRIVNLATRQGGAISRGQLRALGIGDARIDRLLAAGWLVAVHRAVFRLGALDDGGVLFAALLATGPGAALSHRSAGHEHALLRGRRPAVVDVTVATTRRARAGLRPHRARLDPRDVTTRGGLRVTTVARTLLDLAAELSEPALQAAVDEARVQRRLWIAAIEVAIARSPGHHGIGALRRAVARHDPGRGPAIGELERRAIGFLRDHRLPPHERNLAIEVAGERFTVDVVWPAQRVALELDGRAFHDSDPAFAADRRRSRRLAAAGWQVIRVTWEDLERRPRELAADIASLLAAAKVA